VQRYGAKISIEIAHSGRFTLNNRETIGPSPIPTSLEDQTAKRQCRPIFRVIEMNQEMIDTVIDGYANAAYRCLRAGFEMILVHGAHGHLISQFVSPYSNKRTDRYGGSLENRARFAIEVLTAIRKKVGNKLAIEYRISANELVPGGMQEDDTIEFVKLIEDKIDLLHVSAGMLSDNITVPHIIQPTYFPHEYNVHRAAKLRKALKVPITTVGSISSMEAADRIIAEGARYFGGSGYCEQSETRTDRSRFEALSALFHLQQAYQELLSHPLRSKPGPGERSRLCRYQPRQSEKESGHNRRWSSRNASRNNCVRKRTRGGLI
jgi:2,4-dienoyl-CoA reductase-like NADH-dependent reductase (Old Yellow Enzyme family)